MRRIFFSSDSQLALLPQHTYSCLVRIKHVEPVTKNIEVNFPIYDAHCREYKYTLPFETTSNNICNVRSMLIMRDFAIILLFTLVLHTKPKHSTLSGGSQKHFSSASENAFAYADLDE